MNFGGGYRLNENLYFQLRFGLGFRKYVILQKAVMGLSQLGHVIFCKVDFDTIRTVA